MIISIRFRNGLHLVCRPWPWTGGHARRAYSPLQLSINGPAITATKDSVGSVTAGSKVRPSVADGKPDPKNDESSTSNSEKLSYVEFASSIFPQCDEHEPGHVVHGQRYRTLCTLLDIGEKEGAEGRAFIYFTPRTRMYQSRAAITATDVAGRVPLDNARHGPTASRTWWRLSSTANAKKMACFHRRQRTPAGRDLGENTLDKVRQSGTSLANLHSTTTGVEPRQSMNSCLR